MGEDHPLTSGGNEPYFDNGSYVVNPKRWEDAVDAPHEVCKPKDYNHISIWYISYIYIYQSYINMVATECMNGAMIQFAMWTRISRSLPWLSFIGIIIQNLLDDKGGKSNNTHTDRQTDRWIDR